MKNNLEERKEEMKVLVDKMANPRQELHMMYKEKMKRIIMSFCKYVDKCEYDEITEEIINDWVENSFTMKK